MTRLPLPWGGLGVPKTTDNVFLVPEESPIESGSDTTEEWKESKEERVDEPKGSLTKFEVVGEGYESGCPFECTLGVDKFEVVVEGYGSGCTFDCTSVIIEASEVQGNIIKRWGMKDHFSEFFCTLKYNENGRYISFIAIQEALKKELVQAENDIIRIIGGSEAAEKALLSRCIVGKFQTTQETPALNDVRWACNTWRSVFGMSVYAMNDGKFLFELPSRKGAEHVQSGEWIWKKMRLKLEWWNPTTGCWPEEIRRDWVWIRILGLPLSMWSNNMFEQIGDQCGGFIEAEEETSLKNHLHWASIKVRGDGKKVPREIEMASDGYVYTMPIWVESPVTFRREKEKSKEESIYPMDNEKAEKGHVGTAKSGENSNFKTRGKQLKEKGPLWAVAAHIKKVEHMGQNLSPIVSHQQRTIEKAQKQDIIDIEIQANICSSQKNILSIEIATQQKKKPTPVIQ
ncbi:hypothetical protein FXO37_12741 [Capsicum annuum]|nr:hypothetical protein FXO37_12741 [Capsicum annuum]